MQIPILIEPVAGNGYRAVGGPSALTAEGATAEEALENLQGLLGSRLAAGARLVMLEVPGAENPWQKLAGMYHDDPLFDEWRQAMADYRRQVEEDPDSP
ncbi:MAG: hypothetical protein L0Z62_37280 [Gemmataceae bacterium]|nr:hypothetical protein [Gemmataceae bacterium]